MSVIKGEVIQVGFNQEWETDTITIMVSREDLKKIAGNILYEEVEIVKQEQS